MSDKELKVLIDEKTLTQRIEELANDINDYYFKGCGYVFLRAFKTP